MRQEQAVTVVVERRLVKCASLPVRRRSDLAGFSVEFADVAGARELIFGRLVDEALDGVEAERRQANLRLALDSQIMFGEVHKIPLALRAFQRPAQRVPGVQRDERISHPLPIRSGRGIRTAGPGRADSLCPLTRWRRSTVRSEGVTTCRR